VLNKRIDDAVRTLVLGFLRQPNLRLGRICALPFSAHPRQHHCDRGPGRRRRRWRRL